MADQENVTADGNAESSSTEVDTQLAEMHAAETADKPDPKEPAEETAAPEVKKVVPLAALHEERRARQELQRQIQENARQQAQRDAVIEQRLAALANPQQKGPNREEDPVGYLDQRLGQVAQTQQQIIQQAQQREQAQAQERHIEQVKNVVIGAAHEMRSKTPDFLDAVQHLNSMRTRELVTLGMPEDQAALRATQELDQATMQWAVEGRNPAATAYEFAKARGYQPKTQSAAEKIAAQQKGTAAAKSLGSGGAVTGKLTAEALANMSDEDFAKLTEGDWRKAMGG